MLVLSCLGRKARIDELPPRLTVNINGEKIVAARIMVVDDEPDLELLIRQKFRKKIRSKEFDFVFANSGVEAIEKIKNDGEIDVVLTDINMPEMDGLTLLDELGEMNLMLKAVIVSAYGDMENIRTAMNRGAFDFVTKPIDLNDLETTINKSLQELQTLKEAVRSRDKLVAIQSELDIATKIQMSLLPQTFPAFPDRKEVDVFAKMTAAREVGGDLYDFFSIDKHRIGFTIGDVSGKGVPAAMLMAISKTSLRAKAMEGVSADACLTALNNNLVENSLPEMFVTIFYGVLDTRNGSLEYCNGGHNLPYLLSHDGQVEELENVGGLFVGFRKDEEYECKTVVLEPGDAIFLNTDGVTEAFDSNDEMFGDARLGACLRRVGNLSLEEIVAAVNTEVQLFSKDVPQADDIACLALRYNG